MIDGAKGTTKLKPVWQVGRPWVILNGADGLVGNTRRVKCRRWTSMMDSKLAVNKHCGAEKHCGKTVIWEHEEKKEKLEAARFREDAVAQAVAAQQKAENE